MLKKIYEELVTIRIELHAIRIGQEADRKMEADRRNYEKAASEKEQPDAEEDLRTLRHLAENSARELFHQSHKNDTCE